MKNFILEFKFAYRLYQKIIRKRKNEYEFIKHIFNHKGKVNVLDLCCGDSYILEYTDNVVTNYIGIDNNEKYLRDSRLKYPNYRFVNSNIESIKEIGELDKIKIDFIFLNGAIHHLNDNIVKDLINYVEKKFPDAVYLTIDPIKDNNKLLNKLMIEYDRGKFIRNLDSYKEIMKKFNYLITDDFFKMSFKLIFHYKNIELKKIYEDWKRV